MSGWVAVIVLVLVIPTYLPSLALNLPEVVLTAANWSPLTVLAALFQYSLSGSAITSEFWSKLGVVLAWSLPLYLIVVWKVSRSDR